MEVTSMYKKIKIIVSCIITFIVLISNVVVASSNVNSSYTKNRIEGLTNKKLNTSETKKIEKEMKALELCFKDLSAIEQIQCKEKNEYLMNYNGIRETIILNNITADSISFSASDGIKNDTCTVTQSGEVIINGNKVEFTNEYTPYGTSWKSTYKGTKPYGSLTSSSYNSYLSSGRSNAKMDDKIKNITISVLSVVIARFVPYAGIGIDIATIAYAFLKSQEPESYNVSCTYDTYTCGPDNYQYRTKIYANGNYSGAYKRINTYEHFVLY